MSLSRKLITVGSLLCALFNGFSSHGAFTVVSYTQFDGNESLAIPDGDSSGVIDTRTVNLGIGATEISDVRVNLTISGEYNGDLYGYLRHGSGLSVLLNRPGIADGNRFGYGDSGFNIQLSDAVANSIASYQDISTPDLDTQLTGTWAPDGRLVDPNSSGATLDAASATATLAQFDGLDVNGEWTLFLADLSNGGAHSLEEWGLEFTTVPEPGEFAVVAGLALGLFSLIRRAAR